MNLDKKAARMAGLWYLLLAIFTALGWQIIKTEFIVSGNVEATFSNIQASEWLYRIGLVSTLIGETCFLLLANALYKLFKSVDEYLTNMLVLFIVACVPITFVNVLIQCAPVLFSSNPGYFSAFEPAQLHVLAITFLNLSEYGTYISGIFFGLWLFPLGRLIYKSGSGLIFKVPGILLIAGCFCYLINSFTAFIFPSFVEITSLGISMIATPAEIIGILWLFFLCAKDKKPISMG